MPFPFRSADPDAPADDSPSFAKKFGKKKAGKKAGKKSRKGGVAPVQKSMMQSGRSLAGGRR